MTLTLEEDEYGITVVLVLLVVVLILVVVVHRSILYIVA
jgi:hypothetical protein